MHSLIYIDTQMNGQLMNNQSEIETVEHMTAQTIKHKTWKSYTVEQEFPLISFLLDVKYREVMVI